MLKSVILRIIVLVSPIFFFTFFFLNENVHWENILNFSSFYYKKIALSEVEELSTLK